MKENDAQKFLRFVTGSSACFPNEITLTFNALTGAGQRPMAHTCTANLVLRHTYSTYVDFADDFTKILQEDYSWEIQSV